MRFPPKDHNPVYPILKNKALNLQSSDPTLRHQTRESIDQMPKYHLVMSILYSMYEHRETYDDDKAKDHFNKYLKAPQKKIEYQRSFDTKDFDIS